MGVRDAGKVPFDRLRKPFLGSVVDMSAVRNPIG
jgi:hypothetical protein